MYHSIDTKPKNTLMRSLHVPLKRFVWQMRLLKMLGYQGLSMSKLNPYLEGRKQAKVVGITFDDGYKNNLAVLPILTKLGFNATCYIVSQSIGGINHWDIDKGIEKNSLMSEDEIKTWINSGMEIGSHTQNHLHLTECSDAIATCEIENSRSDLEKRFNTRVVDFCYPYGSYDNIIIDRVKKAGYQSAVSVNRARSNQGEDLFQLPRVSITHRTFTHLFLLKILTQYEDRRKK